MDNDYSTMDKWIAEVIQERLMPNLLDEVSEISGELMGRITVDPGDERGIDAGINIIRSKIFHAIRIALIDEQKWKVSTVRKTK